LDSALAKKDQNYSGKDVKVLTDIEHVRLRTPIYLGDTTEKEFLVPVFEPDDFHFDNITVIPAMLKAVSEVIDNSIDELVQMNSKNKVISIDVDPKTQIVTVSDNGRGIPIDKHPSDGRYTPEVALTSLRAGRNFEDDRETGVIGQNGVGASVTAFCSEWFRVTINRDGKTYTQVFTEGTTKIGKPSIRNTGTSKTGTTIEFKLDPLVFKHTELPLTAIYNRAYEIALTNPTFTVILNGTKIRYKGGMMDLVKSMDDPVRFAASYDDGTELEFIVVPNGQDTDDELAFTWVNSSLLYDGGICNTQFINAFTEAAIEHLESAAKKRGGKVTKNDVLSRLLIFGNLKLNSPSYDSQAKTRLTGPNLRNQLKALVTDGWKAFAKKHREWLDAVLEEAVGNHHAKADEDAAKDHKKKMGARVEGLLDCASRDRDECYIFITEGLSANAPIKAARNANIHATFAMSGKFNSVYDATVAEVLKMGKLKDLLLALGLTPGQRATSLRYGHIVLSTDADVDGSHICTLFINLLFRFWPELFDPKNPKVYRLMTPNVVAYKGDTRIHFSTQAEYQAAADKYKGWAIKYYKGLGGLIAADWKMIMADVDASCQVIVDDGKLAERLKLHFSDDVAPRRAWMMGLENG
jgi:DNA gyrase subunit B